MAYYEKLSGCKVDTLVTWVSSAEEMALVKKLNTLETENKQLRKVTDDLKALVLSLEARVGSLEGASPPLLHLRQQLQLMTMMTMLTCSAQKMRRRMKRRSVLQRSVSRPIMRRSQRNPRSLPRPLFSSM